MEAVDARETRDALRTFLLEEFDQFVFTVALIPKRKNPCVLLNNYVEKMKGIPIDFLFFSTLPHMYPGRYNKDFLVMTQDSVCGNVLSMHRDTSG